MSVRHDVARLRAELARRRPLSVVKEKTVEELNEELQQLNDRQLATGMSQEQIDSAFEEYARKELAKEFGPDVVANLVALMMDRREARRYINANPIKPYSTL